MANNVLPWKNLSSYYFVSEKNFQKSGNFRVKCLVCTKNKFLSTSASSSANLRKHLKFIHPSITIEPIRAVRRKSNLDDSWAFQNVSLVLDQSHSYCKDTYKPPETIDSVHSEMDNTQRDQFFAQCKEYRRLNILLEEMQLKSPCKGKVSNQEFQQSTKKQGSGHVILQEVYTKIQNLKDVFKQQQEDKVSDDGDSLRSLSDSDNVSVDSQEALVTASQREPFFSQCADYNVFDISLQKELRMISKEELSDSCYFTAMAAADSGVNNTVREAPPIYNHDQEDCSTDSSLSGNTIGYGDIALNAEDIYLAIGAAAGCSTNDNGESTTASSEDTPLYVLL